MMDAKRFVELLGKFTKAETIGMDDVLFGEGLNLSSIGFTEFIMELEEEYDADIDIDSLDGSIKTVAQLFERVKDA